MKGKACNGFAFIFSCQRASAFFFNALLSGE